MSDLENAKAQVIEELEQVIEKDRQVRAPRLSARPRAVPHGLLGLTAGTGRRLFCLQRSPRMADEEHEEPSVMLTEDKEDSVQRPMRTGEGFVDEEGIRNRK